MRIAFFTNNYLPRQSGVAHSIENFRAELERLGHEVFIFAPRYTPKKRDKKERNVFRFPSLRLHQKLGFLHSIPFPHSLKIKNQIKDLKLDIIHSHHHHFLGKTALKYAQELKIPLILTIHTPYHQYPAPFLGVVGDFAASLMIENLASYLRACQLVIVPTPAFKKSLTDAGIKAPIQVLSSGIDLKKFQGISKEEARKKLGLPKKGTFLLTVGRLSYEKNIDFLIESFKEISRRHSKARLIIVGDGFDRKKLERLSISLGLDRRIIFTGKISYRYLPYCYAAADVFVYSSLFDSQALVLCEAMAAGLPIVTTNQADGPRSIVKNHKVGFLTPPDCHLFAQKILYLLKNPSKRKFFGENARKEAQKYDKGILAARLEKLYQQVLEKKNIL